MSNNVRLFIRRELQEERDNNQYLDQVLNDFKLYKSGQNITYFGKDVPYHDPRPYAERAGIRHVHLLDNVRTLKMQGRGNTSDRAIVYTEASMNPNMFYVIDLLNENAHAQASSRVRDPLLGNKTYIEWVIEKAEQFRNSK
ncbi:putative toxin YafO [Marinomonas spartinae]|uniref:Putative toxin YafO n=1 Tax=Marinomonas spartinae TaxID=1792290 RepID=A0A1A8T596_9GAMM|nr:type II toxin-antitoxin system YafO family toxin [Marinomonas spartinae]SBS26128.1 putative toxin YafO [Marinomonas spartinae]